MTMDKALHPRDDIDGLYEKKEDHSPALEITWMQRYENSKMTLK